MLKQKSTIVSASSIVFKDFSQLLMAHHKGTMAFHPAWHFQHPRIQNLNQPGLSGHLPKDLQEIVDMLTEEGCHDSELQLVRNQTPAQLRF